MEIAKITSKGQVTIPKAIRRKMAVGAGDRLAFEVDSDGALHAFPIRNAETPLRGLLSEHATGEPIDSERIDEGIRRRTVERFSRR
ncbi:MAG: AbrB/MazE/SpoVT family DNA-binding domain-containing protein [Gammaproteobacteria bacterium]|nr:AbrB/MazE/SpoVT family DNA-binding domain-containing protein [Gammaproteobacteria bacterium]